LRQVRFGAQTVPHAPQLFRSNAVFTQVLLQLVSPVAQVHVPFTQPDVAAVPWQTVPHAPQLKRSFWRSRQMLPQFAWPTGHWHEPATHCCTPEQERPHMPQLARSLWRSMHRPLHRPKPPVQ
jgi:hypothetical protein